MRPTASQLNKTAANVASSRAGSTSLTSRRTHLDISIGNFTYLMLSPWKPVVQGHCCILPLEHQLSTVNLDDNVLDVEIQNFKKCLIMMFSEQGKDVVFLETVMDLNKQHRHCLVDCIPLPRRIASQAPMYFKKAIDEAEDEWRYQAYQHTEKELIKTGVQPKKGKTGVQPKKKGLCAAEGGRHVTVAGSTIQWRHKS